jgi:GNAT superfamily N-acetyltransferase
VCAAYSKWITVIGREPTPMTADFNKAVREHDINLAIVAGEVVGLIGNMATCRSFLDRKYSGPPSQAGNGIGRTLLAHVESKATQLKLGEIRLQTNEAFEANIGLYTVLGYKIDRREPFKCGTTVFMSKNCKGY